MPSLLVTATSASQLSPASVLIGNVRSRDPNTWGKRLRRVAETVSKPSRTYTARAEVRLHYLKVYSE